MAYGGLARDDGHRVRKVRIAGRGLLPAFREDFANCVGAQRQPVERKGAFALALRSSHHPGIALRRRCRAPVLQVVQPHGTVVDRGFDVGDLIVAGGHGQGLPTRVGLDQRTFADAVMVAVEGFQNGSSVGSGAHGCEVQRDRMHTRLELDSQHPAQLPDLFSGRRAPRQHLAGGRGRIRHCPDRRTGR